MSAVKGSVVTYQDIEKKVWDIEAYKFKIKDMGKFSATTTFSVNLLSSEFFNIPESEKLLYEFGAMLVPYQSYQSSSWRIGYNNWKLETTENFNIITFKFTFDTGGGYGSSVNQKWFSLVAWCKPIDDVSKKKMLPQALFRDHRGETVTYDSVLDCVKTSASDVIKCLRITPKTNIYDIPFTNIFSSFDRDLQKIGTTPSLVSMYTNESNGFPSSYVKDDDYIWFNMNENNSIVKNRDIEFLLFKGIR